MAPLYPAILAWGIVGAAWCFFSAGTAAVVFLMRKALLASGTEPLGAVRALVVPAGAALVMVGAVATGRALTPSRPSMVIFVLEAVLGAAAFVVALAGFDRLGGSGITAEVRPLLRAIA